MMFEMVLPACQIAMRVGFSSLLYHEDVTSKNDQPQVMISQTGVLLKVMPGKKGASQKPMTKRTIQKPAPLLVCQ